MTKGTIIEVNVSELGLVTAGGKVRLPLSSRLSTLPRSRPFLTYLRVLSFYCNLGCLGKVRPDHQQPRARRLREFPISSRPSRGRLH